MNGRRQASVLFLSMFAGQAAFLVLSPILTQVAREFELATATVGQVRVASGVVGGLMALSIGIIGRHLGLRDLLMLGLLLLGAGSVTSALAGDVGVFLIGQLAIGAGFAIVLSSAVAAAAEWAPEQDRARLLSWAFMGQPVAWIVGMPVVGIVAEHGWRWTWLTVPLVGSVLALLATRTQRPDNAAPASRGWTETWAQRDVRGWATGELLAYAAWGGTLIYGGALLVESYGARPSAVGLMLAAVALAYIPGNMLARRLIEVAGRTRVLVVVACVTAAAAVTVLGMVRPSPGFSVAVFMTLGFIGGARTLAGSAMGLRADPGHRVRIAGIRAAATQFGYLLGAGIGGAALGLGGYGLLGAALGALFLAAAAPHATAMTSDRARHDRRSDRVLQPVRA